MTTLVGQRGSLAHEACLRFDDCLPARSMNACARPSSHTFYIPSSTEELNLKTTYSHDSINYIPSIYVANCRWFYAEHPNLTGVPSTLKSLPIDFQPQVK